MKRQVLYSGSRRPGGNRRGAGSSPDRNAGPAGDPSSAAPEARHASASKAAVDGPAAAFEHGARESPDAGRPTPAARMRAFSGRHGGLLRFFGGMACALLAAAIYLRAQPQPPALTQEHIDAAVLHTLETKNLPSRATKAAELVQPSLVRVRGFADVDADAKGKGDKAKRPARKPDRGAKAGPDGKPAEDEVSVGSGVVIVDDGTILTNLHVVYGSKRVKVTFYDGTESEAFVVSVHPENDLAVIKAERIPDDLPAATLGSAGRLRPGDEVVAVGFPFGMGPSVSAGVVSGLNREFRSPEGERILTRLIQFDAAANPGSSGGPLITMQGDVVGIVTAILNPTDAGTFIGIGFAVTIAVAGRAAGVHPF